MLRVVSETVCIEVARIVVSTLKQTHKKMQNGAPKYKLLSAFVGAVKAAILSKVT